jgi:hypothetical protein
MALSKRPHNVTTFTLPHPGRRFWFLVLGLSLALLAWLGPSIAARLSALTYPTFTLVVQDVDGAPIANYRYMVNLDNTGNPADAPADCDPINPGYPATCDWPSIRGSDSNSPVVATGDNTTVMPITLPQDRYLISVLAPGYKLGGRHVTLDATATITVELAQLQPNPLPLGMARIRVFHDGAAVNSQPDIPREGPPCSVALQIDVNGRQFCPNPADAFHVILHDPIGENTVDWFGNPICTEYQRDQAGNIIFDPGGAPIPVPDTGGKCLTDPYGEVAIPNLGPGKYAAQAIPPDGQGWIQTSTIEGKHEIDVWVEEGDDGWASFEGFQAPMADFGFVRECAFGSTTDNCPANDVAGAATITGRGLTFVEFIPQINQQVLTDPLDRPWVALNDIINSDAQVFLGRGNPDGTFSIPNVPDGTYQLVIWDDPLDYIIWFRTVTVAGGVSVDVGDIGVPRWFGWLSGYVFLDDGLDYNGNTIPGVDLANNGRRDCAAPGVTATCERGLPGVDLDVRFRNGSLQYANLTDSRRGLEGYYSYDEIFPFGGFTVAEVGFGRFARTGLTTASDFGLAAAITETLGLDADGGGLLANHLPWFGIRNYVEWGKRPYAPDENGGISGVVYYAVTRNELDPRLAAVEDYEPGIPGVTVRLYDATGTILLNETQTDAWSRPTGCVLRDSNGSLLPDPLGLGPNCIEAIQLTGQLRPGVFDGGYAFESLFINFGAPSEVEVSPLPPGDYVVEVVPPPGYEIVKEEDQNTDQGDDFIPLVPPPPCVGALHYVDDPRNPADGTWTPLCDRRRVTLNGQQNAASDFFLFTDVPIPGRLAGYLFDDLNIETNPNLINYGEKRGVGNTPIGIRDYTGRLITTVRTDPNGAIDVLLPSTYTASCPTPGGVCPGMYRVVGNDPGDPASPNPDYNPNYETREFIFDVWPGKTTPLDIALLPIANVGATCSLPDTAPEFFAVSQPWISFTSPRITIFGENFGSVEGALEYGGISIPPQYVTWSDTQITIDYTGDPQSAFDADAGARQLSITTATGQRVRSSITIHVLGAGYNPTVVTVTPASGFGAIQNAIEAATGNRLIVVMPGVYTETLILHDNNRNIKLQGVGPGGVYANGSVVQGSVLDGRFALNNLAAWTALLDVVPFAGNAEIPQGQILTYLGQPGDYGAAYNAQLDGFRLQGSRGEMAGAIYVNAFVNDLEISNNVIWSNFGGYGGAVTIGQPYVGDNNNDDISVHHNRILNNGGARLAGGVGIFNGADNYEFADNDLCGNYSAEYGGGLSHFGLSTGGRIHHNRVYYNASFDEGGGLMVGGELPLPPAVLGQGSGMVSVYDNLIQANLANDDGGGVRLLQPLASPVRIANNLIVNNVATDIGSAIALDDAANVVIVNNTIARNNTTSTAEDSDGLPAAAVSSQYHSVAFEATNPPGPAFSDPVLLNNIFWQNLAYTWDGAQLNPGPMIDLELFAAVGTDALNPRFSLLTVPYIAGSNNQVGLDPQFAASYANMLDAAAFIIEPNFVTVNITNVELPVELQGNYHVAGTSPAVDAGVAYVADALAPCDDFDGDGRPNGLRHDVGADEQPGLLAPAACLAFSTNGGLPGVHGPFSSANIYSWDGVVFEKVFDRVALGLPAAADVDALIVEGVSTFYVSFSNNAGVTLPGVGTVQDEDIVRYNGGVWSWYFDGSDVGLTTADEDVDAFDVVPGTNDVLISTLGNVGVPGVTGLDEDLLRCTGGARGAATTCTAWSLYFDGSDIALTANSEDVDGASAWNGGVFLTTLDAFSATSGANTIAGAGTDVFGCLAPTTGLNTACGGFVRLFSGADYGLLGNLDAIDLP